MEKFTFFWNGPFSQWHMQDFSVNGIRYNCAEQYMMAQKAKIFNDEATLLKIMTAKHPREQKKLGRKVKNFYASKWEVWAKSIVYAGNYNKFKQNNELLESF